jgi:hypothetical protein
MRSGGVVRDDAPHRRPIRAGGIGTELKAVCAKRSVQRAKYNAGLDAHRTRVGVDFEDAIEMASEIYDDGLTDGLAREAAPGGTGQKRDTEFGRRLDGGVHVIRIPGNQNAERVHLVDGGVRAVEHPVPGIGTKFSIDTPFESAETRVNSGTIGHARDEIG